MTGPRVQHGIFTKNHEETRMIEFKCPISGRKIKLEIELIVDPHSSHFIFVPGTNGKRLRVPRVAIPKIRKMLERVRNKVEKKLTPQFPHPYVKFSRVTGHWDNDPVSGIPIIGCAPPLMNLVVEAAAEVGFRPIMGTVGSLTTSQRLKIHDIERLGPEDRPLGLFVANHSEGVIALGNTPDVLTDVLARLSRVFGEHRRIAVLVDRQTAEAMQRYLELQPVLQNVVVHLSDGTKEGPPQHCIVTPGTARGVRLWDMDILLVGQPQFAQHSYFAELMTDTFNEARKFVCCEPISPQPIGTQRTTIAWFGVETFRPEVAAVPGGSIIVVLHRLRLPRLRISGNEDYSEALRQGVWICPPRLQAIRAFLAGLPARVQDPRLPVEWRNEFYQRWIEFRRVILFVANNVQRHEVLTGFGLMNSSGHSPGQTAVFDFNGMLLTVVSVESTNSVQRVCDEQEPIVIMRADGTGINLANFLPPVRRNSTDILRRVLIFDLQSRQHQFLHFLDAIRLQGYQDAGIPVLNSQGRSVRGGRR